MSLNRYFPMHEGVPRQEEEISWCWVHKFQIFRYLEGAKEPRCWHYNPQQPPFCDMVQAFVRVEG